MPSCHAHAFCLSVYRVGRRISRHQLVPGAGHTPGQPTVCLVESYSRRLSVGLCSTGHLGNLRQGLCSPQDPPRQPAWLLPLVSPCGHLNLGKTWNTVMYYAKYHPSKVFLYLQQFDTFGHFWLWVIWMNWLLLLLQITMTNWDIWRK